MLSCRKLLKHNQNPVTEYLKSIHKKTPGFEKEKATKKKNHYIEC